MTYLRAVPEFRWSPGSYILRSLYDPPKVGARISVIYRILDPTHCTQPVWPTQGRCQNFGDLQNPRLYVRSGAAHLLLHGSCPRPFVSLSYEETWKTSFKKTRLFSLYVSAKTSMTFTHCIKAKHIVFGTCHRGLKKQEGPEAHTGKLCVNIVPDKNKLRTVEYTIIFMRKGKCTHCPHPHRVPGPGYPGLSGTYKYSNWLLYGISRSFQTTFRPKRPHRTISIFKL